MSKGMDNISNAIAAVMDEYQNEFGKGAKLENGEEVAAIFNDGVITIGMETEGIKIKIVLGEAYKINKNILGEVENNETN